MIYPSNTNGSLHFGFKDGLPRTVSHDGTPLLTPLVSSLQAAGPNMPWPEMIGRTAYETEMIQRAGPNGEFHVVSLNGKGNYCLWKLKLMTHDHPSLCNIQMLSVAEEVQQTNISAIFVFANW
jgi:hypothetical protein